MLALFKTRKFDYIVNLTVFLLMAFVYPSFSFRSGIFNVVSIIIYGIIIIYFILKSIVGKKIYVTIPIISLLLFAVSSTISTALNPNSYLTTSLFLCVILTVAATFFSAPNDKWIAPASLGYAIGTIMFILYLLVASRFNINNLNTAYFVNVNRLCNTISVASILLSVNFFVYRNKRFVDLFIVLIQLVFLFFLLILGSRGSFVISLLVIILNCFLKYWKKHKLLLISAALFIIALFFIVLVSVPRLQELLIRYFEFVSFVGGNDQVDYSSGERFNMQITALHHFLESPLFGHGIDGYLNEGPYGVYSHNSFTEILCNFGILGFAFFELPLFFSIFCIFKTKNNSQRIILITLSTYFLFTQLTSIVFSDKLNALVYGLLIGTAIYSFVEVKKENEIEIFSTKTNECHNLSPSSSNSKTIVNTDFDYQIKANKSFKWSALAEIIAKIVVPVCNMILSRVIAPSIFGIVASISVITGLADVFADGGFSYLILHKKIDNENEKRKFEGTITLINTVISFLITIIIVCFSNPLASLVGADGYGIYLIFAAIQIPFYGFSTIQLSICRRDFMYAKILVVRIVSLAVQVISTIALACFGYGMEALILRGVIGAVLQAILVPIVCKKIPRFAFSLKYVLGIRNLILFYLLDALIIWGSASVDTVLVNHFFDQTLVGVFKNAITMENSIITLLTAIYYPVLIALLGQAFTDNAKLEKIMFGYQKVIAVLLVPIGVGMFLYRDFISLLLFGNGWSGASWVIGILGLANCLRTVTCGFALIVFYATGKPLYSTITNLVMMILKIICYFVFARLGFVPLLVGLTIPLFGSAIFAIVFARIKYGIKISLYFKNIGLPLLFCLPMSCFAIFQIYLLPGVLGNLIGIIMCVLIYFIFYLKYKKNDVLNLVKVISGKSFIKV